MIRLGGLVNQKVFGKFEQGKVVSNPMHTAFIKEAEGSQDHEVSMANNSLDTIIKMATELKAKMGENEKDIPAWIQDHITNAENFISQASSNYHEYGQNEARIAEDSPCWKGYKQVGMKDKGGRQVPNCVPNESVVNEAPNTGERIQNLNNRIKALRDKLSATKSPEQKKLFQDRLKNALQTLSNIKKDFGIKKEISNKTPKIFVKTAAVEKKIRELMADRKKAVVPYNTEKDPAKKEKLKQILIKLTQQIQGYEKNLIQLRDMEEEYLQQMHADAELDTTGL